MNDPKEMKPVITANFMTIKNQKQPLLIKNNGQPEQSMKNHVDFQYPSSISPKNQ